MLLFSFVLENAKTMDPTRIMGRTAVTGQVQALDKTVSVVKMALLRLMVGTGRVLEGLLHLSLSITTVGSMQIRLRPSFQALKQSFVVLKKQPFQRYSLNIQKYKNKMGKLSFLLKKIVYTYATWGSFSHLCPFFFCFFFSFFACCKTFFFGSFINKVGYTTL